MTNLTQILVRGGKKPFDAVSYERTLAEGILGTNSGNLVFAEAVWRQLFTKEAKLTSAGYAVEPRDAPGMNERFDHLVLPFANAFRRSFQPQLDAYTALVRQLRIPVTVVGIGAQSTVDYSMESLEPIRASARKFVSAVLDRGPSIGVRGEFSYQFVRNLGFSDAEVVIIGCPSLFRDGNRLPATRTPDVLGTQSRISINLSPYIRGIEQLFRPNFRRYPHLYYIPQNSESLTQLLWAGDTQRSRQVFPRSLEHPIFGEDRVRFFVDPTTWVQFLTTFDFVFGTRIHGNMVGLLAGAPSFVVAHDARTLELARYFEIPHCVFSDIVDRPLAEDLLASADYGPLHANHEQRFDVYRSFLESHGLNHVFLAGNDMGARFDKKMARAPFPPALRAPQFQSPAQLVERIGGLAREVSKLRREAAGRRMRSGRVLGRKRRGRG